MSNTQTTQPEPPNYDQATRDAFCKMYVASRPAAIRALFPVPGQPSMDGIARQATMRQACRRRRDLLTPRSTRACSTPTL